MLSGCRTHSPPQAFGYLQARISIRKILVYNQRSFVMIKSIIVPYVNSHSEGAPLQSALALAEKFKAHVTVLVAFSVPAPIPDGWHAVPYDTFLNLREESLARAKAIGHRVRLRCEAAGTPAEVRVVEAVATSAATLAAFQARYTDIGIVPVASKGLSATVAHEYFSELLLHSGRPVLVMPESKPLLDSPKRVVIAWQPTRETTRAVNDAMTFLHAADSVDVLVVDPEIGEQAHGQDPGADIATQLARHGLRVNVIKLPSAGGRVAAVIDDYVRQTNGDLLVAGGYGHSRLREFLLGGVTRELVQSVKVPTLFSH
jgi:nucleotide-binding universal stress UspA family protein